MALTAQQKAPVAGYAQNWGTKQVVVAEVAGPSSYLAGGQSIAATDLGWGGFDFLMASMLSYSGTYFARIQPNAIDAAPSAQKPALTSVQMLWYVVATGSQVADAVDLSTEIIRIMAISI